ncbi:MAG: hypothetical protein RJA07_936 [Bacteroidota bacterium]|jgi:hypothetical protein
MKSFAVNFIYRTCNRFLFYKEKANIERYTNPVNNPLQTIYYIVHLMSENTKFAYELANALNDLDALPIYITFANRFQEQVLRNILQKVMSIPERKIKRTRGALFTYLVKQQGNGGFRN